MRTHVTNIYLAPTLLVYACVRPACSPSKIASCVMATVLWPSRTTHHNCKMFDSQPSRPRENLVSPSKCQLGICTALQSANQKSSIGKGKHAHACMPPGIESFYPELPWNSMSLRDSEEGMAVPMGPKVQGYSSIRHASHQPECRIGGRGCVLETRPHRSCKRFRSARKGQRCYCHILDTYKCSRYKSLHFRFTHTLHATQNVSYSQDTLYNGMIRSNLNRDL